MFAVLKTGGKQYKVQAGDVLRVELIAAATGDKIQFNEILMVGGDKPVLGAPLVKGAAVQAEVIEEMIKADKVITYWKRRRKHSSQRTRGHRQKLTLVRVTDILASGAEKSGVKDAIGTHAARVAAHNTAPAEKKAAPAKKAPAKKAAAAETKE
ncbi:MAG: 50S ribosomal protein L21 [Albidovulum sp.]